MTQNTNVVKLMVKHHCKIEKLLENFEANIDSDYESLLKTFSDFEWELEKHIFIEERVIYTQYNPDDIAGGYKMLPKLTTQHNFIINKIIHRKSCRITIICPKNHNFTLHINSQFF